MTSKNKKSHHEGKIIVYILRSKFAEVQCAFAECEKLPQTYHKLAVAEHLLQFCGICGCGIEFKFAVPRSANSTKVIIFLTTHNLISSTLSNHDLVKLEKLDNNITKLLVVTKFNQ